MGGTVQLAYDYPVLGVFLSILWFFLWVLWLVVLFRVIVDLFRDRDMGGGAKAGWLLFVLFLPFLGVVVYLVARGSGMGERELRHAEAQQKAFDTYIRRTAAGGHSQADDLAKLSELRVKGELSEDEYQKAKEMVLH